MISSAIATCYGVRIADLPVFRQPRTVRDTEDSREGNGHLSHLTLRHLFKPPAEAIPCQTLLRSPHSRPGG